MIFRNGKKYFTLSEANALIPSLEAAFGRILLHKAELDELSARLSREGFADQQALLSEKLRLPSHLAEARDRMRQLVDQINGEIEKIHETGGLVKGIDAGLVDFYSRRGTQDILLCWQYGEREIRYFHGTEEGFSGRRPLDGARQDQSNLN